MTSISASPAKSSLVSVPLLLGILLIAANLRAPITSLGPVLSWVQRDFALSPAASGLLNALPLLLFAAVSPFAPLLSRRLELERALFAALLAIGAGCVLRSTGVETGLWAGTVLIGAGIAVANVLMVPLIKRDFPQHATLCIGLYAATMALTAAVASGVALPLAGLTAHGWKLSLGLWFALALVSMVAWLPRVASSKGKAMSKDPIDKPRVRMWRSAVAWQVSMFMALQTLVFYTLIDWFPAIASDSGIDAAHAGTYLFAYQAVAVVANLIASAALKRLSDQRLLGFICSLATVIGVSGLLAAPAQALWWLLFAGAGAGMSMVTCLAFFGLRSRDHHEASALSGMAQCVGYGLGSAGPLLAGWLHDFSGGWHVPLAVLLIAALLQMVFAVIAGRTRYV